MAEWSELDKEQRKLYFIDDEERMERDFPLYRRDITVEEGTTLISINDDAVYDLCEAGGGDEDAEIIHWIAHNAKGKWASPSVGSYWFENPEDALFFKLRWYDGSARVSD